MRTEIDKIGELVETTKKESTPRSEIESVHMHYAATIEQALDSVAIGVETACRWRRRVHRQS
jgi:hypothetical protein